MATYKHATLLTGVQNQLRAVDMAIAEAKQDGRTSTSVLFYQTSADTLDVVAKHLKDAGYLVQVKGSAFPMCIYVVWGNISHD